MIEENPLFRRQPPPLLSNQVGSAEFILKLKIVSSFLTNISTHPSLLNDYFPFRKTVDTFLPLDHNVQSDLPESSISSQLQSGVK